MFVTKKSHILDRHFGPVTNNNAAKCTSHVKHVDEEPIRDTVLRLDSNMQLLMKSLANLANNVSTQSPMVASPSPASSPPALHNNRNETNKIYATPLHRRMKRKTNQSHKKSLIETGKTKSNRKLFLLTIARRDCTLSHFFEPLHNTHYDGLNESVAIPKVVFIEDMLSNKSFYDYDFTTTPHISAFTLV
ncbi:hypothetical protein Fmac_005643 [Flemingia macrophylla]|uniref:Uncharacterized protein n=1 Tax=Flemingia macrophylla TaxID=520843 RepID=A0ABD1N9Q1_9FABA